jgi:hypothetical protein
MKVRQILQVVLEEIPMGRAGHPDEIARMAAFLASDDCGIRKLHHSRGGTLLLVEQTPQSITATTEPRRPPVLSLLARWEGEPTGGCNRSARSGQAVLSGSKYPRRTRRRRGSLAIISQASHQWAIE